jgi:TrmH family RNA methyltransferase
VVKTAPLCNVIVVLHRPKDVVNIAGVIRVMMNMGLLRLRLVKPDEFDMRRIDGVAHRSRRIVDGTEFYEDLESAVSDAIYVVGTSARARSAKRNTTRPRTIAPAIIERAHDGRVAIVFGREDKGLPTEALDLCHEVIGIPTDLDFPSLNLAQACLVVCYELLLAVGDPGQEEPPASGKRCRETPPATQEDLEKMYGTLESGLEHIDFFEPREATAVMRTFRTLLSRAEPSLREAKLVEAIGHRIDRVLGRSERAPDDSA